VLALTPVYAGILALAYAVLSGVVIRGRQHHRVSLGHGGNTVLERRIRAHGNFAEYVPFALLLLSLVESRGGAPWLVHALGLCLTAGRILHGYALLKPSPSLRCRVAGMVLTLAAIGSSGLACLVAAISGS